MFSMAVIIRLDVYNVKHDGNDLVFNDMSLCLQNCEYLAENKLTNNNLLFFIILYTLLHENNYVYLCIFGSIFYWSLFVLFISL